MTEPEQDQQLERGRPAWARPEPGRLVGKGHMAGDLLEAYDWIVLDKRAGYLKIEAGLPQRVRNPRGQLFGGFTPTYVDLVALFTVRVGAEAGGRRDEPPLMRWLATSHMSLDYFEPITGPTFVIVNELEKRRGRTNFVVTRFFQDDVLAVLAATTISEVKLHRPLGDA
jgi:acyl-coenzyme A thioesterase PaaI-like protein